MLPLKAGDTWAFVTNHETSLPIQREIIDELRSLSAQRTVYNSKENAMIAPDLICHAKRQMKYPRKLFSISPRCVSCLHPHAKLQSTEKGDRSWLPGIDISMCKNKTTTWIIWRHLSCLPASLRSNSCTLFFISNSQLNLPSHPPSLCCRPL